MAFKLRAIHAEDKETRRGAILDAAQELILTSAERLPAMEQVAHHAGLAKGTVYLYFASKEELLLAVHTRNASRFFQALIALANRPETLSIGDLNQLVQVHMIDNEGYLPLAVRTFALMDKELPVDAVIATKARVSQYLYEASAGLVRHFPQLGIDESVRLLQQSYALILGMWQLFHPIPRFAEAIRRPEVACFNRDFATELSSALTSLWLGRLSELAARDPAKTASAGAASPLHTKAPS
jgi:AcrR family transcriptional regulator